MRLRAAARALLVALAAMLPLSTSGMQVAVGGLAVVSALAAWRGGLPRRRRALDWPLATFAACLVASSVLAGHPLESAAGYPRRWIVLTYFVAVTWISDVSEAARLVRVWLVAAALGGAYGILQHFTGADWYRQALGRPLKVFPMAGDAGRYIVVGFFRNWLTFAHLYLFPLSFASVLILGPPRARPGARAGRADPGEAGVQSRGCVSLATSLRHVARVAWGLVFLAVVFSHSRGVWLAYAGVVALLGWLRGWRATLALALAVGMAGALALALTPRLGAVAASVLGHERNRGRLAIYAANLDIVRAHPIAGLGFGRYRHAAGPYYGRHPHADRRSHAHNDFLQMAAEGGILGLLGFSLFFAAVLRRVRLLRRARGDPLAWGVGAGAWLGVVGFLLGGLTQYNFGDSEVAMAMWFVVALLVVATESPPPDDCGASA